MEARPVLDAWMRHRSVGRKSANHRAKCDHVRLAPREHDPDDQTRPL
jgi:hypothetical protein